MIRFFSLALISCCLLLACNTSQKVTKTTQKEQIRFGHGGGFTGAITEYCLTSKGEVYKKEMGTITKLSIAQQEADQCFEKREAIQFGTINLNSPGNFYAYIAHHHADSIHRVDWNPYQPNLSTDLVEFHNMLLTLVGEEPITVRPTEALAPEGDKVVKKRVIGKLKPLKEKSNDKKKEFQMKTINHKKLKKKNKM